MWRFVLPLVKRGWKFAFNVFVLWDGSHMVQNTSWPCRLCVSCRLLPSCGELLNYINTHKPHEKRLASKWAHLSNHLQLYNLSLHTQHQRRPVGQTHQTPPDWVVELLNLPSIEFHPVFYVCIFVMESCIWRFCLFSSAELASILWIRRRRF